MKEPLYHYQIQEEIQEEARFYRKSTFNKDYFLDMTPSIIRDQFPAILLDRTKCVIEESIFYEKENKVRWTIAFEDDIVYSVCGSTCLTPLNDTTCKVSILIRFEMDEKDNRFFRPFIEKRIPDLVVKNTREMYEEILNQR